MNLKEVCVKFKKIIFSSDRDYLLEIYGNWTSGFHKPMNYSYYPKFTTKFLACMCPQISVFREPNVKVFVVPPSFHSTIRIMMHVSNNLSARRLQQSITWMKQYVIGSLMNLLCKYSNNRKPPPATFIPYVWNHCYDRLW